MGIHRSNAQSGASLHMMYVETTAEGGLVNPVYAIEGVDA